MKSDRVVPVAIVGGGFSGTMVAAQLARRGVESIVIEGGGTAGQGVAFSTTDPAHLLNVPAGNMSAWPDDPTDFAQEAGDGAAFAQRRHFGRYLRAILDEALASGRAKLIEDRVVGARHDNDRWTIELAGGDPVHAEALVLATGNQPPARLPFAESAGGRLIANPWGADARAAIADSVKRQLDVLIVGTGLTMVDVMLSLDAAGHQGRILAVSRRGLAPRSHAAYDPVPVDEADLPEATPRSILGWLRRRSQAGGWRAAIDSLRPYSQRLWQALSPGQQRLFLRHARPWWDVHRHRIAPQVGQRLDSLIAEGRLEVLAGRLTGIERDGDNLEVSIRRRGEQEPFTRRFAYIFNCTGPLGDIGRTGDPLLRQLLDDGLVTADELAIGLEVDERSRAAPGERLWALGTLTKGRYWEIIAVPDIRTQAAQVAEDIAMELAR